MKRFFENLGILLFFGYLDKKCRFIKYFQKGIDFDLIDNWNIAEKLNNNEVVRISDSILSTHVFYKTFIDENFSLIGYSKWIELLL